MLHITETSVISFQLVLMEEENSIVFESGWPDVSEILTSQTKKNKKKGGVQPKTSILMCLLFYFGTKSYIPAKSGRGDSSKLFFKH